MKELLFTTILSICLSATFAQNGLEEIIVEKYYVSEANDTIVNADGGVLPVGSVTYRIYADMLPGYKFQAAFGVPGHELRIETSTLFFNNEDRGATSPTYTKSQAANNTVMLDSWLSVGAACNGQIGVLKTDDDGASTVINADGVLQGTNVDAGIPLTQEDGMIAGTPEPVTIVGINTEVAVFDNQNDGTNGPLFATSNGSWASLNGSTGADSLTNRVLIAQITTDGTFSFELNIQIGTPSGGVEQYVAQNPTGAEIQIPSLVYNSLTSDIPKLGNDAIFKVYPNPVSGSLFISDVSGEVKDYTLNIYGISGSKLYSESVVKSQDKSTHSVNVSNLSPGMYFIELNNNSVRSTAIFIKD